MRYRTRSDANTKEIDRALRDVGASVVPLGNVGKGVPDRLVGFRQQTYLLEIKNRNTHARKAKGDGDGLHTPDQEKFIREWQGRPVATVYDPDEALEAIGAK